MLNKNNRLTCRHDFERVFKTGQGMFCEIMGIKTAPNQLNVSRFGIVVSAKISKKAVERNKIRRRIREVIKKHLPDIKSGYDIVIIARQKILNKKFQEIEKNIISGFKKLNLLIS